ncbi:MAG: hypothetical protein AAGM67_08345, partial [Bacteroidota bacterium]
AIEAGFMVKGNHVDTLGFSMEYNRDDKCVFHIDTEQAKYSWDKNYRHAIKRAGITPPDWFKSVWLKGLEVKKMYALIEEGCKRFSDKYGGMHMIILDGIADLVNDPNDYPECKAIIDEKLAVLAEDYNCPLITILHVNPGSEKERGHLGSHLRRKCETMMRVSKSDNGQSIIKFPLARNTGEVPEIHFQYNRQAGYHTFSHFSDLAQSGSPAVSNREAHLSLLSEIMPLGTVMTRKALISELKAAIGSLGKAETAYRRIKNLRLIELEHPNQTIGDNPTFVRTLNGSSPEIHQEENKVELPIVGEFEEAPF